VPFVVILMRWFSIAALMPFLALELTFGYFVADYFVDIWRVSRENNEGGWQYFDSRLPRLVLRRYNTDKISIDFVN